ncbi:NAD(P)H-binding protein [Paenibacillus sp. R14(2021)]|uniref:NAD(P)H-binding protein n=1 Tax=Paenibacillus sp. R14(2021) TaxID=2859228 RepID=UPI001C613821|nr:NAD(P)H-binding protein [Paenibacillus sp. R14(2021)]
MVDTNGYSALLVGATGLVGFELLQQLLGDDNCKTLTVLVRRPLRTLSVPAAARAKMTVLTADFDRLEEALADVEADIVFCTLGTTIKKAKTQEAFRQVDLAYPVALGEWAKSREAGKYIIVSAMGASVKSSIFYNRVKGEMEALLGELGLRELHIVRPSLLLGKREEFRLGEKLAILLSPVLKAVMQGPLRSYRPVRAEDVASFMRRTAEAPVTDGPDPVIKIYENHAITVN